MSLATRVRRLERHRGGGCGPGCPPLAVRHYRQEAAGLVPCGPEDGAPAPPCPRCGRRGEVLAVAYDRDFYANNAHRLAGGKPAGEADGVAGLRERLARLGLST